MSALERRGKGIILFHDIHASTMAALPVLLTLLKAKGFKVVHLRPKFAVETIAGYETPPREAKLSAIHRQSFVREKVGHGSAPWLMW
jgi:hypothetical protein